MMETTIHIKTQLIQFVMSKKSLIPECTDNIRGDSNCRKTSTPLLPDEKHIENTYIMNNVDSTGSPGCKVHHHHHHHHHISSMRANPIPLRLPLHSPKEGNKKNWNVNSD